MAPLPIIHSIVDAAAIGPAIRARYALPDPFHCSLLARGMTDVYLVRAAGEPLAARLYRSLRTEAEAVYELDLLDFLEAAGLPVAPAIRMRDGGHHFSIEAPEGRRTLALFRWARGSAFIDRPTVEHATKMGELIARCQVVAGSFPSAADRPIDLVARIRKNFPALANMVAHRPDDLTFYRRVRDALTAAIDNIGNSALKGATHGDSTPSNFFIDEDAVTILDFETCGYGYLSHELASFYWTTLKNGLAPEISEAFMAAYDRVRPRSKAERDLFPIFVCAKEFSYLCGFSAGVNAIGYSAFRFPGFDWFADSVRRNVAKAGLL